MRILITACFFLLFTMVGLYALATLIESGGRVIVGLYDFCLFIRRRWLH